MVSTQYGWLLHLQQLWQQSGYTLYKGDSALYNTKVYTIEHHNKQ